MKQRLSYTKNIFSFTSLVNILNQFVANEFNMEVSKFPV